MLLKFSAVQEFIGSHVSQLLEEKLGTRVVIGKIDIRLPNRVIIDNVMLYDQQHKEMLTSSRLSAAIDLLPLLDGEISISSAQLFGLNADIYKSNAASQLNCQFVIDSLASKDTTSSAPLHLNIASLIIRNGSVRYNQYDQPLRRGKFTPYHIDLSKISSHVMLYKLTDDSLDVMLKRLSFEESSGIKVNNLKAHVKAGTNGISLSQFAFTMPNTSLSSPGIDVRYAMESDTLKRGSLVFDGKLTANHISPSDFTPFLPDELLYSLPVIRFNVTADGTDMVSNATLSLMSVGTEELAVQASADINDLLSEPTGELLFSKLHISEALIASLSRVVNIPDEIKRVGTIEAKGRFKKISARRLAANADFSMSNAGKLSVNAELNGRGIKGNVDTKGLDISCILDDKRFGNIDCNLDVTAMLDERSALSSAKMKGRISDFSFNDYPYRDINIDASYDNNSIAGKLNINDPNIKLNVEGTGNIGKMKSLNARVTLDDFSPKSLHLSNDFGHDVFALQMDADMRGTSIDDALGTIAFNNVMVTNSHEEEKEDKTIRNLTLTAEKDKNGKKILSLASDFADITLSGDILLTKIPMSFLSLVSNELSSVVKKGDVESNSNNFSIDATIRNIDFAKRLVNIPVDFEQSIVIGGYINSQRGKASVRINAPDLNISGTSLAGTDVMLWTPFEGIQASINTNVSDENKNLHLALDCTAKDNVLYSTLTWNNVRSNTFAGKLITHTTFYHSLNGKPAYEVSIPQSHIEVGDSIWTLRSQGIKYEDDKLAVNHFEVGNTVQHVYVNGIASSLPSDTLSAELYNVNVGYIMNLINFHSVEFDGMASGSAMANSLLGDIVAKAHLDVSNFRFQDGRMGTLHVDADYSNETEQIDIDAIADDPNANAETLINGFISPQRNEIDLAIKAENTRMEFMESFCSSFMKDVDLHAKGDVRLHGLLSAINLEGQVVANGAFTLIPTNCRYAMEADTINFVPDDILFPTEPIKDKYGNVAYITGGVHHVNLGRISYDLTATTNKLLAYDFPELDGSTFCGHAVISGDIGIHGRGNELSISADATPLEGSYITYNASSPDAVASQDFITWGSASRKSEKVVTGNHEDGYADSGNDRTNIRMNFMVNMTPAARLHLLMDATTGDYIDLFGNGALRVNYFNKGTFEIFGNYAIEKGTYKMTIQNLLRKDFTFRRGGTIAFGGDPYNASLLLQAQYMLNSVSLADLSMGSSFKSNNVPVNCLMNISGTPGNPKVEFNLDLPSLSSDAKQMVQNVINSEEEMTQQVLYLLAIGRFYSQNNNDNSETERTGQTSLAMQSFLSGTLSQQFNNVMSRIIGNRKWSFGANIAPGNDGFNNAEYEGLLSGRLFNDRLIFNGQFGYRDRISTNTQSFIGDFTLQYLLTRNGMISLKVYNQTNDRYFTRNSLNTQGVGIVFQKEF